jgi:hypothetical protein
MIVFISYYLAMKAYQDHQRSKGEEVSNPLMKQVLAGVAAPGAIKLVETKGLDFLDGDEGRHRLHDRYRHRLF